MSALARSDGFTSTLGRFKKAPDFLQGIVFIQSRDLDDHPRPLAGAEEQDAQHALGIRNFFTQFQADTRLETLGSAHQIRRRAEMQAIGPWYGDFSLFHDGYLFIACIRDWMQANCS